MNVATVAPAAQHEGTKATKKFLLVYVFVSSCLRRQPLVTAVAA
jgi:hypothetical protein